jgi:hydroxymethylbilane synthase
MTASRTLTLATRGSRLALAQATLVIDLLRQARPGLEIHLRTIATQGDLNREVPLADLVAPDGVFTRGVEAELLAGRAHLAVHSLKDVPTALDARLVLAAFPPRGDVSDVLVAPTGLGFDRLPAGATVGTSSPRRQAQTLAARPDLRVVAIRGNVDTRLAKLRAGEVDALILAAAGLERLELHDFTSQPLPLDRFLPAVGQGSLVAQCRADDLETGTLLTSIDDPATRAAIEAERAFLRAVGGGCRVPVAGLGRLVGGQLELRGFIAAPDGSESHSDLLRGPAAEPAALGLALAERLLALAGDAFVTEVQRAEVRRG